jgi:hypothetical protein
MIAAAAVGSNHALARRFAARLDRDRHLSSFSGKRSIEKNCRRYWSKCSSCADEADLSDPIILSQAGAVTDGMHRVAKAAPRERDRIDAVQFDRDREPDRVGLGPEDLPY